MKRDDEVRRSARAPQRPAVRKRAATPQWRESYCLVVDCTTEARQRALFEQLQAAGFKCRVITM